MTRKREIERPYAPDLVSAETLAYRLDCSRSTIDDYVERGYLPKPLDLGTLKRWVWQDVLAHIQGRNGSDNPLANASRNQPPLEDEDPFSKGVKRVASSHA